MDKERLERLKRLKEILFDISMNGYANKRLRLNYKQFKHFRIMLEKLSVCLYEECILNYEVRKKFHKEIREMIKVEED